MPPNNSGTKEIRLHMYYAACAGRPSTFSLCIWNIRRLNVYELQEEGRVGYDKPMRIVSKFYIANKGALVGQAERAGSTRVLEKGAAAQSSSVCRAQRGQ